MITSTINKTFGSVILCDRENLQIINTDDEILNEMTKEQFEKAMDKKWSGKTFAFIRVDGFDHSQVKMEMDENTFIENARVLYDSDSKVGMITRTLKAYQVTYTAITKDRQFVTDSCYVSKLVEKQLQKQLDENAKAKGYVMVFEHEKPIAHETLYGMERYTFVEKAKEVK